MAEKDKKRRRRYPWSDWLSKEQFTLKRGKDFECLPHGMAQMVRDRCSKEKITVVVKVSENEVHVEVRGREAKGRKVPGAPTRYEVRCLGPGLEHKFRTTNPRYERLCPECRKKVAELTEKIYHYGGAL